MRSRESGLCTCNCLYHVYVMIGNLCLVSCNGSYCVKLSECFIGQHALTT